jgi:hypothetical protein
MSDPRIIRLAAAVREVLVGGLEVTEADVEAVRASLGEAAAGNLPALLGSEEAEEASFAELLLSPGPGATLRLEPALAAANLTGADVPALCRAVAPGPVASALLLPGGRRAAVTLAPEDAARFVARLKPAANPPAELVRLLAIACPPEEALAARVGLRHSRLAFDAEQTVFLAALIRGLADEPDFSPALTFALGFLGHADARDLARALAAHLEALLRDLMRAERFAALLAGSNFETLRAQGVREPHLDVDALRRELTLADRVGRAVYGPLSGLSALAPRETDLGSFEGPEGVDALLRFLTDPD